MTITWQRLICFFFIVISMISCFVLIINNRVVGIGRHYFLDEEGWFDSNAFEHPKIWNIQDSDIEIVDGEPPFDCILVLGAYVKRNGEPSWTLADRCEVGVEAYQRGLSDRMLLSGDHGQLHYDEVTSMQKFCEERGVLPDDIFLDHAGFSTYESMVRAKEVFGAQKVLIITQRFHLYRALYMARALGLEAYGMDSALRYYGARTSAVNTVRELGARVKGWFDIEVSRPSPRYLGDPIDLNGSGRITHEDQSRFYQRSGGF